VHNETQGRGDFDFQELCLLAKLYRQHGTTNPCLLLSSQKNLSKDERCILELVISKGKSENVRRWYATSANTDGYH
jgi:hypothetical protein